MPRPLRVLLVADTHIGFDLPAHPRVQRPRRGHDFLANLESAMESALTGNADLVVHGGDLLYRSKVPARLVHNALEPLLDVADRGVPVILVPGNHERSALPYPLLAAHLDLHVLDRPRTLSLAVGGTAVSVAGFPCERKRARTRFRGLLASTEWQRHADPVRLLCLHQTFEGARVGPVDHTFRHESDVIRGRDIPSGFAAVLAGHIHRHQVLTHDLAGHPLAAPVVYPGSIERTSRAERGEPKGFVTLVIEPDAENGGRVLEWHFHPLPTRPMVDLEIDPGSLHPDALSAAIRAALDGLDPRSVVTLRVPRALHGPALEVVRAANLRRLAPATMIVETRLTRR